MPKNKGKRDDDDSTSDSGPDDLNPPKKSKASASGKSSASRKEDEEEPTWVLESKRLLKVREFKGKLYIDIREYYEADGELKPGKKGISLSTSQWRKLKDIVEEVDDVVKKRA
ncbi:RNA polymerase II transcriptional coactivator [Anabrus simplex]|uniref:RNA polymerase II transcriptional coactivator n=1 Tax=Anabrus simplex TaxID=316456 RepID=UPI0034DCF6CE